MSTEAKNVSHTRRITDVVVFVFKPQRPRKFDDLPFPLRVNSSTFRWLESSFLRTFTLYCEFLIDQDDFRSNFLAGGTNVRSKSPWYFEENSREQRLTFVKIRSHYFCTVLYLQVALCHFPSSSQGQQKVEPVASSSI